MDLHNGNKIGKQGIVTYQTPLMVLYFIQF
jgi:hypothetical protein